MEMEPVGGAFVAMFLANDASGCQKLSQYANKLYNDGAETILREPTTGTIIKESVSTNVKFLMIEKSK